MSARMVSRKPCKANNKSNWLDCRRNYPAAEPGHGGDGGDGGDGKGGRVCA